MSRIKSLIAYPPCLLAMFVTTLLCLPIALMPEKYRYDSRLFHKLVSTCSRLMFFFGFVKYKIQGKDNLLNFSDNPAIYVINHTSSLDIPMIEVVLGDQPKIWISKNAYAKIPIFGFVLQRMHVIVNRENTLNIKKVFTDAIKLTQNKKRHLMIFPEGRRYDDGNIHDLFAGFAILAEKLNRPVVPVAIYGFHKLFPKKSMGLDYAAGAAKISIGKPIVHSEFLTRDEFIKHTHNWFEKELEKLRKE